MTEKQDRKAEPGLYDFENDLARPIVDAIRHVYELKRKHRNSIPWTGPNIGAEERRSSFAPKRALSKANLRYAEEEQGRDPLDTIIGIAIQLGIEQGRRMHRKNVLDLVEQMETLAGLSATRLALIKDL